MPYGFLSFDCIHATTGSTAAFAKAKLKRTELYTVTLNQPPLAVKRSDSWVDELVKSRPEAMFVNYHEGHKEHELEIIIYFFVSSCPSW
jgi:hypothetical protein